MSDLRQERERAARRWDIAVKAFPLVVFFPMLAIYLAMRECDHDLFGWGHFSQSCTAAQIETWLFGGADWMFWLFSGFIFVACVAPLVTVQKKITTPSSPATPPPADPPQ